MRLPHPLRFSEGGNLCGLHRAGFLSVCVTLDAPRTKSKSQEVESIVSHPLKFAEGGAASVGLMEGWASPPLHSLTPRRVPLTSAYRDQGALAVRESWLRGTRFALSAGFR